MNLCQSVCNREIQKKQNNEPQQAKTVLVVTFVREKTNG